MQVLPKCLKGRKASEVFLEYADPYLEMYLAEKGNATLNDIEEALKLPWFIWNAVMLEGTQNSLDFMASLHVAMQELPMDVMRLIEFMKERKLEDFAKYRYLLGDFKLQCDEQNQEVILSMETRAMTKRK